MTTLQQIHEMVDKLNPSGLNYIIGVLNGLDADKWINVPLNRISDTVPSNEKEAAYLRLEAQRHKFAKADLEDLMML